MDVLCYWSESALRAGADSVDSAGLGMHRRRDRRSAVLFGTFAAFFVPAAKV